MVRSVKWREIAKARNILHLGDQASLLEIKAAYHRLSKIKHPDVLTEDRSCSENGDMAKINKAYALLVDYAQSFLLPLTPEGDEAKPLDAEDWWLERFGEDPLWGKNSGG